MRTGQAMIETLLAVLIIAGSFFVLFELSRMLTAKILAEHAAFQVARARAVGLNRFMCLKVARYAVIPASGRRLRPEGESFGDSEELARKRAYFMAATPGRARGVLDYEGWNALSVDSDDCRHVKTELSVPFLGSGTSFTVEGSAGVEENASLYLMDSGL